MKDETIADGMITKAKPTEHFDYDAAEKELENYTDVFADIVNALIYEGKQAVAPGNLKPAPTETIYQDVSNKLRMQREDLGKYEETDGEIKVLYLFANQSKIDGRMLLRKCGYTGGYYRGQYRENRKDIYPVMEIVLYWGKKRWKNIPNIRQFFKEKNLPERTWKYIDNEQLHVFEMRYLPDEVISRFKSDMGILLEYLKEEPDPKCLNQRIRHVEALLRLLKVLSGNEMYQKLLEDLKASNQLKEMEEGEGWTMCRLLEESWENGEKRGIELGTQKGIQQGIQALILAGKNFGMSFERTADELKERFSLADAEVQKNMAQYW